MRADSRGVVEKRGPGFLGWASRLLVAAGAVTLAWCTVLVVDARMYQRAARQALAAVPPVASPERADVPWSDGRLPRLETPPVGNGKEPGVRASAYRSPSGGVEGTPLGTLSIPRVKLSVVVLQGTDARTLRRGVGHIENTAFPGDTGNVAIAGHRDSFFMPLQYVKVGDDVLLDTPRERLHYRVSSLRVVAPTEVSVLNPTADAVLTLTTCYPFGIFGSAPDRFVVQATRVVDSKMETTSNDAARSFESFEGAESDEPIAERVASRVGQASELSVAERSPSGDSGNEAARSVDDEALVRQAVERFKVIYDARLVRRGETRSGALVPVQPCSVNIEREVAAATCGSASASTGVVEPGAWVFSLGKTGRVWEIRSVEGP